MKDFYLENITISVSVHICRISAPLPVCILLNCVWVVSGCDVLFCGERWVWLQCLRGVIS